MILSNGGVEGWDWVNSGGERGYRGVEGEGIERGEGLSRELMKLCLVFSVALMG